jgi:hypothetical protein
MLAEAGVDSEHPDPARTWLVFKAFASEPVDGMSPGESDLLLFQSGPYEWSDGYGLTYGWILTRQFSFDDERGVYDHMEQLECGLYFDADDRLSALQTPGIWSGGDLDEWFATVEADEGFRAVDGLRAARCFLAHEEV